MGFGKELLLLGLACALGNCVQHCKNGFSQNKTIKDCTDINECSENPSVCGNHSRCFNTIGSYYCQCQHGFRLPQRDKVNFTATTGRCQDTNECIVNSSICGEHSRCINTIGSYYCQCQHGFIHNSRKVNFTEGQCIDLNECTESKNKEELCGPNGECKNIIGSYWCNCSNGYTNYSVEKTPCSKLDCDNFSAGKKPKQFLGGLANIMSMMRNSCLALSGTGSKVKLDGDALLEKLFTETDAILSPGTLNIDASVSELLTTMEESILFIGPQLKNKHIKMENNRIDAQIAVQRGTTRPTGEIRLSSEYAYLDTDWATAAGTGKYSGFAVAALLSYKNLESSVNRSFEMVKGSEENGAEPSYQVFSKVVSVVVSNPSTQTLSRSVNITFRHLEDIEVSPNVSYICAYWTETGAWSTDGCSKRDSNASHTICTCNHLSSFAVLMALHPIKHTYGLELVTKIGLTISLLCLTLCILTFKFCRSIQGTRTTIHLHLCICLFIADLIFLAGISKTEPVGGCRFVAAMLHFFFLAVFTWMLLEGVQLYRMVVLVFNATMRPLYLYAVGYGTPLFIVSISACARPNGYGTKEHCWLSTDDGFVWSFFGPVCLVIFVNVFFFIITVWKLAQKFASLNPDLSNLHKIKAFTVTAVAQMCILGLMWVSGVFLFQEDPPVAVPYIFTIFNSLQGALVFIMHCLLSKQVREEYANFLSCICTSQKKRYSDLSTTNPSSSQSQGSKSGQQTGESQI
ncbi:unnamed protein product [Oreochromis niloticus]|nr:unnamed protein product [Mustela putorius furo]